MANWLIAEGNPVSRLELEAICKELGHTPIIISDGDALDSYILNELKPFDNENPFETDMPTIAFLSTNLPPNHNATVSCDLMRHRLHLRHIPIVLLQHEPIPSIGDFDYVLESPFSREQNFRSLLEEIMTRRQARNAELLWLKRFLLVEDEMDIRNVVQVIFRNWGYDAAVFSNGITACAYLENVDSGYVSDQELPSFALMDIRMPGPNGNEIAYKIRQSKKLKNIPIILMTAFQLDDFHQSEMRSRDGVDHIVFKPLPDWVNFYRKIEATIAERQWLNER
ncbi:MAG: hypothetical protein BroJett018_32610 [Chloroflexota bacterium]|nr:response regulator [Chloroflexota bacterium]NOG62340.1 response regulator [Chloroflexota bacterium]GIK65467.1 MAG: hypothetical protein BroJett018_32610 [Chloroflexota bacterium]